MSCPEEYCERQCQKLCWSPKRLHQLAFPDQLNGLPCCRRKSVWQAGLPSHEAMLAVTNDCIVFWVFFNTSLNNPFHDFIRHWRETDRPVISRVFLLALLENQDNACQLPVSWDLSWFPRNCLNIVTSCSVIFFEFYLSVVPRYSRDQKESGFSFLDFLKLRSTCGSTKSKLLTKALFNYFDTHSFKNEAESIWDSVVCCC